MENINEVVEVIEEVAAVETVEQVETLAPAVETKPMTKAERKAARRAEREAAMLAGQSPVAETPLDTSIKVDSETVGSLPDSVPVGVSYAKLGEERANELSGNDDIIATGQGSVRDDLLHVIAGPQEAWSTYTAGFKTVLDARVKEGKPVMSLTVIRSQASRILNAAKTDFSGVKAKLENNGLRWNLLLKSLPKRHAKMGAPSKAETGAADEAVVGIDAELNVGTLVQIIAAAAKRLEFIGVEKKAPFAHYVGCNIREMLELCQKDFHKTFAEHRNSNGDIKDYDKLMDALSLTPRKDVGTETLQTAARMIA